MYPGIDNNRDHNAQTGENREHPAPTTPDWRILVADQDPDQRELIGRQIRNHVNAQILDAGDGHDALRQIGEHEPNLVIANLALPRVNGLQLCRLIRTGEPARSAQVPLILTSENLHEAIAEQMARSVHAFGYLLLPCEVTELTGLVDAALGIAASDTADHHCVRGAGDAALLRVAPQPADDVEAALRAAGWSVTRVDEPAELPGVGGPHVVVIDESELIGDHGEMINRIRLQCPRAAVIMRVQSAEWTELATLFEQGVDDMIPDTGDPELVQAICREARMAHGYREIYGEFQEKIDRLRSLSDYLDMVIDFSQEAIFTCDLNGDVRIWNKGAEKMYGYSADEIIGKNVDTQLDPPDFKRKSHDVVKILAQRGSFTEPEVRRKRKDGEVFPVTATYSQLLDATGEFIGFSVVERDVTPIKALEAERIKSARLRAITQTAVTANDHINTPLGVILGYSQFLKMKLQDASPTDVEALNTIQNQVHKIKGIMNKLKLMSDPIVKNYSIEGVTMLDLSKSK